MSEKKYFKLENKTIILKYIELLKRCEECKKESAQLAEEFGFEEIYKPLGHYVIAGGIGGFGALKDENGCYIKPNGYVWGDKKKGVIVPSRNKKNKVGVTLCKIIDALPIVTVEEYNDIIGFKEQFVDLTHIITFSLKIINEEMAVLSVYRKAKFPEIEGLIEITSTEYYNYKDISNQYLEV